MRKTELEKILAESTGEREVSIYLAKNPEILRWAICRTGGHSNYIIKEFPFGAKFKCDFVVLMSYSGVWQVNFVELEPHNDTVVTKQGLPSNRLNGAISQINDWKTYIEQNPSIRKDLSDWCMKKDILKIEDKGDKPLNFSNQYLESMDTYIDYNYYIFIGNRGKLTPKAREKMNQLARSNRIEIFTYGRFLDIAENHDTFDANPMNNVLLTKSAE